MGRRRRPPLRAERGPRRLHDDQRRHDVDQDALRRSAHDRHRDRHRSIQSQSPARGDVSAPAHGVGLQRRRSGQRHVREHGWRAHMEEDVGQRPASRHDGPDCARLFAQQPQRGLRADRSRGRQGAPECDGQRRCGGGCGGGCGGERRSWRRGWSRRRRWWRWCRTRRAAPRPDALRYLAVVQQRTVVDLRVHAEPASDVLQPDSRRPQQRRCRVRRWCRSAEVDRRRQDVEWPQQHGSRRQPRDLD